MTSARPALFPFKHPVLIAFALASEAVTNPDAAEDDKKRRHRIQQAGFENADILLVDQFAQDFQTLLQSGRYSQEDIVTMLQHDDSLASRLLQRSFHHVKNGQQIMWDNYLTHHAFFDDNEGDIVQRPQAPAILKANFDAYWPDPSTVHRHKNALVMWNKKNL